MSRRNGIFAPAVLLAFAAAFATASPAWAGSWARTYNTGMNEGMGRVEPAADGGFIVAGTTYTGSTNRWDGLVIKLNKQGTVEWSKTYGGTSDDGFAAIKPTWDGGFVAVGYSVSFGTADSRDLWIVKMAYDGTVDTTVPDGSFRWERTYGGSFTDEGFAVVQCPDGNYAVAGYTTSVHGTGDDFDAFLLKVAYADGAPLWETTYGGDVGQAKPDEREVALDLDVLADGNLVAVGSTDSWGAGQHALVLTVSTTDGSLILQRYYDQGYDEEATAVCATPDGGCLLTGFAYAGTQQGDDLFAMKLNPDLTIQYQQRYGGSGSDRGAGIQQTHQADGLGSYYTVVTGFNNSNTGGPDVWVLKLDSHLQAGASPYDGTWQKRYGGTSYDSGSWIREAYDGGYIACANTDSFGTTGDVWVLKIPSDGVIDTGCQVDTTGMYPCSLVLETPDGVTTSPAWTAAVTDTPAVPTLQVATQCESCDADAFEPDDNCYTDPSVLHGGESQTHNFCDDSADWISFNACEGGSYTVSTSGTLVNTDLEIVGTDCATVLDSDMGGGVASITWLAPASGTFHIRVSPHGAFTGEYTVSLTGDTSQCPGGRWSEAIGGPGETQYDSGRCATMTADGGSVTIGFSDSFGATDLDAWIVKLNHLGRIELQNAYGGTGDDKGAYVEQTPDGGYIACGDTGSFPAGSQEGWVLKLDSQLRVGASYPGTWQKRYGGDDNDYLVMIRPTLDGGYIAIGYTTPDWLDYDLWVLKLDGSGDIEWQKVYGGMLDDARDFMKVRTTQDGGYIVASSSSSFSALGDYDGWIVKLDPWGDIQWQLTYGGALNDATTGIDQLPDGGYALSGQYSTDTSQEGWLLRVNAFGAIQWQKRFTDGSGLFGSELNTVRATSEGGLVAAGDTWTSGVSDAWILNLDASGGPVWQKGYDISTDWDIIYTLQQAPDGSYLSCGTTMFFSPLANDYWVMRPDVVGAVGGTCTGVYDMVRTAVDTAGTPAMSVALLKGTAMTSGATTATAVGTSASTGGGPPTTAPGAPTLTPGCLDVGLSWTAVTDATDYEVWRNDGATCSGATQVVSTTSGATTYNDAGRSHGTQYSYFVKAKNICGTSGDGTCATTTTLDLPAAPAAPTYTNISCATLTVNWPAVANATSYDVWRADGNGSCTGAVMITGTPVNGTTYNDTSLTASSQYSYFVTANNTCGTSANGTCSPVTTAPATPAAPAAPTFSSVLCDSLTVNWTAVANATSYDVWRASGNGTCAGAAKINAAPVGGLGYDDSGLSGSTQYSYFITATNSCGTSSPGTCAPVTTIPCAVYPIPDGIGSTTPMNATKTSDTTLTVTFDTATCSNPGASHNILWGSLADVGTYTLDTDGKVCGVTSGDSWTFPSGNIFWIIVAKVGPQESSWGKASNGDQRSTSASGRCGASSIDTTSTCH
jgi:hypothetical protein